MTEKEKSSEITKGKAAKKPLFIVFISVRKRNYGIIYFRDIVARKKFENNLRLSAVVGR